MSYVVTKVGEKYQRIMQRNSFGDLSIGWVVGGGMMMRNRQEGFPIGKTKLNI
jgi:hypothetical protein